MSIPSRVVNQFLALHYISELRKEQWKTIRTLKNLQFKRLKAIIKHGYNYVPYYHRLFKNAKLRPEDIKKFEDMRKIPLTSKQDVQKNFQDMVTRGINVSKLSYGFTSGSTGVPLKILRDSSFKYNVSSIFNYILFECGVKLKDNFVAIRGRESKSIKWGKKYVRLWGDVCETVVPLFPPQKLVEILRLIKPDVINTFPSILNTLYDYDVSGINPRIVFTQGEVLTQHCRNLVKKMFYLEPFETYGSVEFGNLAFECQEHKGLHMLTNSAYIEFVDDAGEYVSPGEHGEIIVTGFLNFVMPLIRYRIGDAGIPGDEKCTCGRSLPIIKRIQGRINDYLVFPSGRKISWMYLLRCIIHEEKKC